MLDSLSFEEFEKLVNTKFKVNGFNEEIELELFEVSERRITPQQESFSLLWRGPGDRVLEQGIYSLENDQFSGATIFIVPVERNEAGIVYQAVFNRLIKAD